MSLSSFMHSQRNQKSELMERASTIHLYTLTPPLTCDGEDKSTRGDSEIGIRGLVRGPVTQRYGSRGPNVDTERVTTILG
jgi:hypothetical protein